MIFAFTITAAPRIYTFGLSVKTVFSLSEHINEADNYLEDATVFSMDENYNEDDDYWDDAEEQILPIYKLDDFFHQFGADIGIYFKNLDTGFVYAFNPDGVFFGASINKAKHALYTYIAAERGYIDMYAVHTFGADDYWGGTGIIRFMPAGTVFTTRELLHHSIVYSDNIAFRMLVRYMNRISFTFHDFTVEIGASTGFTLSDYSHKASAADTAIWFDAVHSYTQSDSNFGHYLLNDLLNTAQYSHPYFTRGDSFGGDGDVNVQLIHSNYPVAQKYGWFTGAFNTAGIVYAPSPFILVIVSGMHEGAHELFEEISWLMNDFNKDFGQMPFK
jgi:beta-lactamase class A